MPVEELEAYGTMLVSFYAREAVANANLQGLPPPTLSSVDPSGSRSSMTNNETHSAESTTVTVTGG